MGSLNIRMRRTALTAGLLMALLTGCVASGERVDYVHYDGYTAADFAEAGKDGSIGVIMIGAPYAAMTPTAGATRISNAMTGANFGPRIPFHAATPAAPELDGYSVVFRFGGKLDNTPCDTNAVGAITTAYSAAFCKDGAALSYLSGVAPKSASVFKAAMRSVAVELFPLENPEFKGCDTRLMC